MRRITIFTDEDTAKKVVPWLEENGVDFMSEDFAEPTLQRRHLPTRRPAPERHEPSSGFLGPLRRPSPTKLSVAITEWLRDGSCDFEELAGLARDRGWPRKKVRDTLRRMVKANKVLLVGGKYRG